MRQPLFERKKFVMHSGGTAHYKIECDALTDEDLDTLAWIVSQKVKQLTGNKGSGIKAVHGIPTAGKRFGDALQNYIDPDGSIMLIVDDVLTTGASMEEAKENLGWPNAMGIVIFARGSVPSWINPIFSMNWFNTIDT